MPGKLRSKDHACGFPWLTKEQKAECDKGTILMSRSVNMARTIREKDRTMWVPKFFTLENPF